MDLLSFHKKASYHIIYKLNLGYELLAYEWYVYKYFQFIWLDNMLKNIKPDYTVSENFVPIP